MEIPKIFESEYRFCLILWENEPISSTKLTVLCNEKLGWSRTTTFTVIRRLCERGVIQNNKAIVTSIVSKQEAQIAEMEHLLNAKFAGNLPDFLAAFMRQQNLTMEDIARLEKEIENGEEKP